MIELIVGLAIWFFAFKGIKAYLQDRKAGHRPSTDRHLEPDNYNYDSYQSSSSAPQLSMSALSHRSVISTDDPVYPEHSESAQHGSVQAGVNRDSNSESGSLTPASSTLSASDLFARIRHGDTSAADRNRRALDIGSQLRDTAFGDRVYKLDQIPSNKLDTARLELRVSEDDIPMVFFDNSAFGSGKVGVLFTVDGIYWKNAFEDAHSVTWEGMQGLKSKEAISIEKSKLRIGNAFIDLSGLSFDRNELLTTLEMFLVSAK